METSKAPSISSITGQEKGDSHRDSIQAEETVQESELPKTYGFWSLMAYQTTILCSWSCNIVLYYYIFTLGGPASLIWGTVIVTIGQLIVMASLGEYCSLWPCAGGQQFYTLVVAPESQRRFLSYAVGWCILVGELSVTAGCALNSAEIIGTFVEIVHDGFEWKPYMNFLLYCLFLILPFSIAVLAGQNNLPKFQVFGAAFNVLSGFTWAIVFLIMAPKTTAKFVFTEFINTSGWSSDGWVFILSFYVPIYGLYGTDGVMHLAGEMKNAPRDAPRVMIWSMVWAGVTAWLSAIVMCFTVGPNWAAALNELSSYLSWFMEVTGSVYGGGVFCAVIMIGLNILITLNTSCAAGRMVWSMAREHAFPYSDYLSHISKRWDLPMRGMGVFFVANVLIGLLILGSKLAFYAILSGGGVALQLSYAIPITCVVLRGRDKVMPHRPAFNLGNKRGYILNWISILWSVVVVLFYVFPQFLPVVGDIENMNWAIVILGAIFIFAGVVWFVKAKNTYLVGESAHPILESVEYISGRHDENEADETISPERITIKEK